MATLDATSDHVMESTRGVEPSGTRHFDIEPQRSSYDNFITPILPLGNFPNLHYVPEFLRNSRAQGRAARP